ncbi:MAG: hypothetical protein QOE25_265, partial [Actinomycetota bacterium]|nr:hypothetical protein [Actinomycetota bacterium]
DFDRQTHDPLLRARLDAISTIEATADAETISTEQARLWLGVLNDLRLVLGTRLNLTEETLEEDLQEKGDADAFALYQWLTDLVAVMIEALELPGG